MSERFNPEEQEAYDKEMQRLEAEAAADKGVKTEVKATELTSKAEEKPADKAKPDETVDETKARLESLEKAFKDTQRWGRQNAAEVKRLKEEAENRKREQSRPAILDANPGLEDAITHVAGKPNDRATHEQKWLESVGTAVPDLETLLGDPAFEQKAKARRDQIGSEWDNPLVAIREITDLKVSHLRDKAVTAASEAARKDFEAKAKKRSGMEVPGGSGGRDTKGTDEAERYRTMSNAEFAKERAKVMGY